MVEGADVVWEIGVVCSEDCTEVVGEVAPPSTVGKGFGVVSRLVDKLDWIFVDDLSAGCPGEAAGEVLTAFDFLAEVDVMYIEVVVAPFVEGVDVEWAAASAKLLGVDEFHITELLMVEAKVCWVSFVEAEVLAAVTENELLAGVDVTVAILPKPYFIVIIISKPLMQISKYHSLFPYMSLL